MKKTPTPVIIDATKPFQFIQMIDAGDADCPHCGARGRYIYIWAEYGEERAAMAGCYSLLTGKIKRGAVDTYIEKISIKQAKNKPLNGWDKTVLRMLDYKEKNAADAGKVAWADQKIYEAVGACKQYAFNQR